MTMTIAQRQKRIILNSRTTRWMIEEKLRIWLGCLDTVTTTITRIDAGIVTTTNERRRRQMDWQAKCVRAIRGCRSRLERSK